MATPTVVRVVEREARVFRRLWRGSVFSSVVAPVMFLAAIGLGLGGLIDESTGDVAGMRYLVFVTPGLLTATAMQTAAGQSLWPVMAGTKWLRSFHGVVATPVRAADLHTGLVVWTALRTAGAAALFLVVATPAGGVASPWAVLAVPAAVLTAAAFAAPLSAFAATQDSDLTFSLIMRLGIVPLFLFSGTFFPISRLPDWLEPVAVLSPLWHGVELARGATTGDLDPGWVAVHLAVLAACVGGGLAWGAWSFARRLTP